MWTAVLLICMNEGLCQGQLDPIVHPTEEMCQMSVETGAAYFHNLGWKVTDFRCIQWDDDKEDT